MTTRRSFLQSTSLLCAAAVVAPALLAQPSEQDSVFSAENLFLYTHNLMSESRLRQHIGSSFTVLLPSGVQSSIRLNEVIRAKEDAAAEKKTAAAGQGSRHPVAMQRRAVTESGFRLSFGMEGAAFPQGSYALEHGVLGATVMFLVPGDAAGQVMSCSAIFNLA